MKLIIRYTLALLVTFGACFAVQAQDFTASSDSAAAGGSMNITATLDNTGEGSVQGWSLGVCHDTSVASVTQLNEEDSSIADFNTLTIFTDGWTQGVVLSFQGQTSIPSGTLGFTMSSADYAIDTAAAPGTYSVSFCDILGSPPVTTVAVVAGASITPDQTSGEMEVIEIPDPEFSYDAPDKTVFYNPDDGNASFTEEIQISEIDNSGAGAPFPNVTQGFSMGLEHDETLLEATGVATTGALSALNAGAGPDFVGESLYSNGWTLGVVYSIPGTDSITYDSTETVVEVSYQVVAGAMTGDTDGETTSLSWTDTLGDPEVTNVMVVSGASIAATPSDGTITLEAVSVTGFLRSDANADSRSDVADAIWMLSEQFLNGPSNNCLGAKDANGDGIFNVADPAFVIAYQFTDGAPPPTPFPDCGIAENQAPEDCLEYPSCG